MKTLTAEEYYKETRNSEIDFDKNQPEIYTAQDLVEFAKDYHAQFTPSIEKEGVTVEEIEKLLYKHLKENIVNSNKLALIGLVGEAVSKQITTKNNLPNKYIDGWCVITPDEFSELQHYKSEFLSLPLQDRREKDSFDKIFADHLEWVKTALPLTTSIGGLAHAKEELDEILADIESGAPAEQKAVEYGDVIFCELDSARNEKITLDLLRKSMRDKLEINKNRTWEYNGNGAYYHVKTPPLVEEKK